MLQSIITTIRNLVGSEYLYLSEAITIKLNPHSWPLNVWAVCVSPSDELYVMDADEQWHQVSEADKLVIPSIYQRVKLLEKVAA
jgi:hypothetical protein